MADDSIANAARGCLGLFEKLSLAGLPNTETGISHRTVPPTIAEDESRFRMWSSNIGAHGSGRRSLQYRLRDASHLQKQVLSLLADLSELLKDALAITKEEKEPWDEDNDDDTSAGEFDLEEADGHIATTELKQIATDVPDVINCLLRLSVAIRNPAPHDRFTTSIPIDASHYEPYDIQHVKTKFEGIDDSLAVRLGQSMSRRRQYFKYRENHHLKVSSGLDAADQNEAESTVASSLPHAAKASDYNPLAVIHEDALSDSGATQTSIRSSSWGEGVIRVPPLPKEASDSPFECPFCYMIITASSRAAWKRHVYADLRPYVCLAEDCTAAEKEFTRRHEWASHELENHWKTYNCPFSCGQPFWSKSKCRDHISRSHPGDFPANQIDAMISLGSRPIQPEGSICPMCYESLHSIKDYYRHVGRHQEQLALFALPAAPSIEDMAADDGTKSPTNVQSEEDGVSDDEHGEHPDSYKAKGQAGFEFSGDDNVDVPSMAATSLPEPERGIYEDSEPDGDPALPQSHNRYICQICNKTFSRLSSFRTHSLWHTDEKPFKCSQPGCGRTFNVKSNMKRHERLCQGVEVKAVEPMTPQGSRDVTVHTESRDNGGQSNSNLVSLPDRNLTASKDVFGDEYRRMSPSDWKRQNTREGRHKVDVHNTQTTRWASTTAGGTTESSNSQQKEKVGTHFRDEVAIAEEMAGATTDHKPAMTEHETLGTKPRTRLYCPVSRDHIAKAQAEIVKFNRTFEEDRTH